MDFITDAYAPVVLIINLSLLIRTTGAYASVMKSNYNARVDAVEILIYNGKSYKLKDTNKEIDNLDIPDGEYREIDLTRPPFLLPKPLHEILDKDELNKNSGFNCYLNLYTKNQINELKIK